MYQVSPKTKKIRQQRIWAEEGEVCVETGNVGGSLRLKVKKMKPRSGKTAEQRAVEQARQLHEKQKEKWYFSIHDAMNAYSKSG